MLGITMSDVVSSQAGTVNSSASPKQPRRLACRRCNKQKLSCRWEEEEDQACIRCRRANLVCTSSTPRRVGRPVRRSVETAPADETLRHWQRSDKHAQEPSAEVQNTASPVNSTFAQESNSDSRCFSSSSEWANSTGNFASAMSLDDQPPHDMARLGNNEIWQFLAEQPSLPPQIHSVTMDSSLTTPFEARMRQADLFGGTAPGHSDSLLQKFWNLQQALSWKLEQIRLMASDDVAMGRATGPPERQSTASFPVDDVLTHTQTFVDIMRRVQSSSTLSSESQVYNNEVDPGTETVTDTRRSSLVEDYGTVISDPDPGAVDNPGELGTPMICILVSCYAILVEVFDETFQYIGDALQHGASQPWPRHSNLPLFQLGNFQLRGTSDLQVTITARIFLHSLRCVEKTVGIYGMSSVEGEEGDYGIVEDDEHVHDRPENPSRRKLLKVILALEADGPGGHARHAKSLRENVERVRKLLHGTVA